MMTSQTLLPIAIGFSAGNSRLCDDVFAKLWRLSSSGGWPSSTGGSPVLCTLGPFSPSWFLVLGSCPLAHRPHLSWAYSPSSVSPWPP
ncbi:hypothetical protein CC78DRAFT_340537 [Lojkania enalia]|uniref:Uncharacterized protein n=1 Tax=Lojkania enalia TaxID=147567 RepID=A0A9P4K4M4_9PLEO|nr:hypothetical protein CC78DRAFT_340537 [Didymosphaeria enalia]